MNSQESNSPLQTKTISEKSNTQKYWRKLIFDVFGIVNQDDYIEFEKRVLIGRTKFIDAYIPSTGIVIEQKSQGIDLTLHERQSDGSYLTPYEQAKRYYDWLPVSQKGRYILTCNFDEIRVHDMEKPSAPPEIISRKDVSPANLGFLLTPGETLHRDVRISVDAGKHVRKLYDYLLASLDNIAKEKHYDKDQYNKARDEINVFCVRLVFLLYAEDSGLFRKSQFTDYLRERAIMAEDALKNLFSVLKTDYPQRDSSIKPELKEFPYVNGGLFHDDVKFPLLDNEAKRIILNDMAEFDWSGINPTIFGAIFEATLNDETRKQEGIHYTSAANIHKLIDPLFLNELTLTLNTILDEPESPARTQKLLAFQEKLSALRFLDPACGSGNFLTESFTSLRRLENSILDALPVTAERAVKVEITQFHGIEAINFAVNIAKTALWISDHQMWKETQEITHSNDSPLPLKEYDGIEEEDALRAGLFVTGWKIPHEDMLYIMGNPPFLGYSQQNKGQKENVESCFGEKNKKVDYAACWFARAAEMVQDKNVKAAFVATNSITQGEQVANIFKNLKHIKIDFAHQSFVWKNELPDPKKMAHVHVVIIGFSTNPPEKRRLFTAKGVESVSNINFYLHEGPDEDIAEATDTPICENAPAMMLGNLPRDGGHLIIEAEDYAEFIRCEPKAEKFIRRYIGAYEFINNKTRYCLWLGRANPDEIKNMPLVYKRVKAVESFRNESKRDATRKLANSSWLFAEIRQTDKNYIIVPLTSSETRRYIPMGFMTPDVIASNATSIIPDATLYHFGVLTSRVHMAWVRRVCGRLKSDYRYSSDMVYNTFAWPGGLLPSEPLSEQVGIPPKLGGTMGGTSPLEGTMVGHGHTDYHERITETAQGILDARSLYPSASLAGLYDDSLMPIELRRAHEKNDKEVCRAYGWNENISEEDIVRELFKLYHTLA